MAHTKVQIADLRPTQLTLGLSEVKKRAIKLEKQSSADRKADEAIGEITLGPGAPNVQAMRANARRLIETAGPTGVLRRAGAVPIRRPPPPVARTMVAFLIVRGLFGTERRERRKGCQRKEATVRGRQRRYGSRHRDMRSPTPIRSRRSFSQGMTIRG